MSSDMRVVELGQIMNFQRGYDLTHSQMNGGAIPVVGSSEIIGYHNVAKAEAPVLLIGRSGTVGRPQFYNQSIWPHNTTLFVTDFLGNVPEYCFYLLKSLNLEDYANSSSVPTLNRNFIHPLKVRVPDASIQLKIASVLQKLDDKITLNNKINAELEQTARLIYDYWFTQFDFPDAQGKPYKSSGGTMVYNDQLKREIPAGWNVESLFDIATFTNGIPAQKYYARGNEPSLPIIKIREISNGISSNTEYATKNVPSNVLVHNGDVLFSWSATLEVILWSGGDGVLNQHIFKVTSDRFPKSFYYYQLLDYLQHFKMLAENRKTTMGHITKDHLIQSKIATPPQDIALKFHKVIKPFIDSAISKEEESQELSKLRDWLLPMLMTGQVKVGE